MIAFDTVGNGPAVAVGAGPVSKALHDQPAGQRIELRHPAGLSDRAAADEPGRFDPEQHAHDAADARVTQVARIVARRDLTGDLLELCSSLSIAIAVATSPSPGPSANGGPGPGPTAGGSSGRLNCNDGRY